MKSVGLCNIIVQLKSESRHCVDTLFKHNRFYFKTEALFSLAYFTCKYKVNVYS
jgi:hypothetical protein